MKRRHASHAGSWYSADKESLKAQLSQWLSRITPISGEWKGVIAPHAGYAYSGLQSRVGLFDMLGETAAHAYAHLQLENTTRIFILGPSHHLRFNGCAVTKCDGSISFHI
jgi:AmmeMemoRadiSam system protein B